MTRGRYDDPVDEGAVNSAHWHALDLVGSNKRVLELGCASGQFTKVLERRGCSVVGVEVDVESARRAQEFADDVVVADLDVDEWVPKLEGRGFDVVLAGDVLEHLRDPLAALRAACTLLHPGGFAVVSLPNIAHVDVRLALLGGHFEYRDTGLLDRTHLRFFTKGSAEQLLRDAGLLPTEMRRVTIPVFAGELGVEPREVPPGVLDHVLDDPECETYQFVFKAVLDDGDTAVAALSERIRLLEDDVHALSRERQRLEAALEDARRARAAAEASSGEAEHALTALQATKLFRYTKRARALYGRLRFGSGPAHRD